MKSWLLFILSFACLSTAIAQEQPGPVDEKESERSIYVPYEELWKVFEKEGRGVFIPYEKFKQLWDSANKPTDDGKAPKAPVDALITEVVAEAAVSEEVVRVDAKVTIEVLKKGWNTVPLRLQDAAITKAVIAGKPARITHDAKKGYQLLVEKQGEAPEVITLELSFAKTFTKSPGRNSVRFLAPLCAVSKWDVTIPESGVEVDIHPMLATTQVPATNKVDETHVLAFVGAAPEVRIDWTPKAEGAKGLTALVSVRTEQQVMIDEGVMRGQLRLNYVISRTELSAFNIEVPTNQKVVNVFDQNVREWSVEKNGEVQTIHVELFEPTKGAQSLVIELEQFTEEGEVAVPVAKALDVGRQQGIVAVKVAPALRAETIKREGLLQLDQHELPGNLKQLNPDDAYRYAALPYTLSLKLEKVQPRILADTLVETRVAPNELTVQASSIITVERAGVFAVGLAVPEGYEVRRVAGKQLGNVSAAAVDGHHLADAVDGVRKMTVNLSRKALGQIGLEVLLVRTLNEADLLEPTGESVALDAPLVRVDAERDAGRLVVYAPESLRINPGETAGLRSVPNSEALAGFNASAKLGNAAVLSYRFAREPASLELEVIRRAPQVTVRQFMTARVDTGVVKYEAKFMVQVLYSGVKSLRIDVPADLVDELRVTTPGIRYQTLSTTNGLNDGMVAWSIEGETEFYGNRTIDFAWETKIEKLDIGKSVEVVLPHLMPKEVDRAWGQIAVAKAEGIDVLPKEGVSGLRPIDPRRDLMPGVKIQDAAQAFEFQDSWQLTIKATRYETKDVKSTSVERGLVRSVITRGDVTSVQAVFRMRSKQQRISVALPEGVEFDSQPLRLNGRPVPLEQGSGDVFFVPLTSLPQDTAFVLELRYFVTGEGGRLQAPSFPEQPAVQQVYMSVYLPENKAYLGSKGPWTEELRWDDYKGFNAFPRAAKSDDALLAWVTDGVSVSTESMKNFATDGRSLLFSTLRPPIDESGALRVRSMHRGVLSALVLAVIILIGITQLNASLGRRAMVVGLAFVAVILLAVFFPTFVQAMVTNAAVAAGIVVLIIWCIWYLLILRPKDPVVRARAEAALARAKAPRPMKAPPVVPDLQETPPAETEADPKSDKGADDA